MDRNALIEGLVDDLAPVTPLPPPGIRALRWLAVGIVLVVSVTAAFGANAATYAEALAMPRFVVEAIAILATAASAAWAAFESSVPGASRRWILVPLAPLALWLSLLTQGCVDDYLTLGAAGLKLGIPYACFAPAALIGIVPMALMVFMLCQGAPRAPTRTFVLAGIAIAAVTDIGVRLIHAGDASIMILVWNFGLVLALSAILGWIGPAVFRRQRAVVVRGASYNAP